MSAIIEVERLSKRYKIGSLRKTGRTLREAIAELATIGRRSQRRAETEIWALEDVTFSVAQGEVVGVVGHNGAGKSTLLKILSRITEPTKGQVVLRGRVASLLEVGTGFHQDLTGRENIFMNGAILGMGRLEIARKFDDIVAFAEVERFIDTPVKHYSSGMYMRLAFAVAAHLDPEILVVDEVLAVGDLAFQQKCLGKLQAVAGAGRTVIFVSHNMGAVSRLCTRGILLEHGRIAFMGDVDELCRRYAGLGQQTRTHWIRSSTSAGTSSARILEIVLCDERGDPLPAPTTQDTVGIRITYELDEPLPGAILAVAIYDQSMTPLFATSPLETNLELPEGPGVFTWRVLFPTAVFMEQSYYATIALYRSWQGLDTVASALHFSVVGGASAMSKLPGGKIGALHLDCQWEQAG